MLHGRDWQLAVGAVQSAIRHTTMGTSRRRHLLQLRSPAALSPVEIIAYTLTNATSCDVLGRG
ncbi:MAG: hypothetical protein ABII12_09645 [Planctomycetota bacterium]